MAYLAHGFFFLGGGNGSIPISSDVASIAKSSSILTMTRRYNGMS